MQGHALKIHDIYSFVPVIPMPNAGSSLLPSPLLPSPLLPEEVDQCPKPQRPNLMPISTNITSPLAPEYSPLPPSDPPSPSTSEREFWHTTPVLSRPPPKIPCDWKQTNVANEYRPARTSFHEWITSVPSSHSTQKSPTRKVFQGRKPPILYSFQKREYCPVDSREVELFMTRAGSTVRVAADIDSVDDINSDDRFPINDNTAAHSSLVTFRTKRYHVPDRVLERNPKKRTTRDSNPASLHRPTLIIDTGDSNGHRYSISSVYATPTTRTFTRHSESPETPSMIPETPAVVTRVESTVSGLSPTRAGSPNDSVDSRYAANSYRKRACIFNDEPSPNERVGINRISETPNSNARERSRFNARMYYERHRDHILIKAAKYRQRKRAELAACNDEEKEKRKEVKRSRQREYSARFREKRRARELLT
ncbi:hypothetical protein VNI00_016808 [Paramarasmius palmivorus]|uniref:Giant n=1 Tax=Paramarasmius palmivorus TaxID=297713 RepID=A0AAW0BES3_9AGAR